MTAAFLGLGSNLGDRLANLEAAAADLDATPGIRVVRSSRVYETAPVGGPPQGDYLNAVVEVATVLRPRELLEACHEVEAKLGRVREERWGPRTLDVDILIYDDEAVNEPDLVIPHPRMHERAFVLAPLLELVADPVVADGKRLSERRMPPTLLTAVRVVAPPLRTRS